MRRAGGIIGGLITFVVVAVVAVAMGIAFGTVNLINTNLNGTLTIPSTIANALNTVQQLGGTSLIVAAAVAILTIVLMLIYLFAGE